MTWFDYKHQGNPAGIEVLNGSLLPVVYSREKVLVHVDCLHPTDTVSITTNDIALPEQGADIRGATASTATALAPTLDILGSASAAGTALGTPASASARHPPYPQAPPASSPQAPQRMELPTPMPSSTSRQRIWRSKRMP